MKEFIKASLVEFAVIIFVLSLFDGVEINAWRHFVIFGEIFIVVMIFRGCSVLTDRIQSKIYILDVLIEFFTAMITVLIFGYIFKWYEPIRIGYMCFVGIVVYFICYILGLVGVKKNADYINGQLEKRRERIEKNKRNNNDLRR